MRETENTAKRYQWLKLKNTRFSQLVQKKIRQQHDGVYMQIVYLKMMLLSVDKEGCIYYQGILNTLEEELALEFSEDKELIKKTIDFLVIHKLVDASERG